MKAKRIFAGLLAATTVCSCVLLSGCTQETTQMQYEIPNYQGLLQEGQTKSDFNSNLFYRNDMKAKGADPFVLDNTQRDGYYYLYVTQDDIFCYRSKNLMDWESVGNALDIQKYNSNGSLTIERRAIWGDIWAPEVVYDPDEQLYYMFFSATPQEDTTVTVGEGVHDGTADEVMMLAVSDRPNGGFHPIDFTDPESCGEESIHVFNTTAGLKDENGEYINAYPHYYAKYQFFNPPDYQEFSDKFGGYRGEDNGGYQCGIDPHPYADENGDKWLFWVDNTGADRLSCVKMINWRTPDWSTAKTLLYHTFYTAEDFWAEQEAPGSVELVPYERLDHRINEGPQVLKHNNKYYLTFSIGSYANNSYQVVQAVSDNLDGPYRKLTLEEGAIILSSELSGSMEVSGPGHHSFVTVGDQLLMVYHRHNDPVVGGGARNAAIDEMKWITIKDKFGNDLDVLYTNGTTATVQPKIEAYADYVNIADEATVTGSDNASYLTDGLLSIYKYHNEAFGAYVQETKITESTTFTFDFAEARPVRAVMVYNSKMEFTAFYNISKMEFVCIENGQEVIRYIENVAFSNEYFQANDYDGSIYYIMPGAAAYAEFDELNVKSVRITVEVPEGQESVGISEIRILGK